MNPSTPLRLLLALCAIGCAILQSLHAASPGELDWSFGDKGEVISRVKDTVDIANDMLVQEDGRILLSGYSISDLNGSFSLRRYNADGSPDAGFGTAGLVTSSSGNESISCSVLQKDGKIVSAGVTVLKEPAQVSGVLLMRHNSDGTLDQRFGSGGRTVTNSDWSTTVSGIALLPDGGIIIAGTSSENGPHEYFTTTFLLRYTTDGLPDETFGGSGRVVMAPNRGADSLSAMALQTDGKIVLAGVSHPAPLAGTAPDFKLTRYYPDGSIDSAFGTGGEVIVDFAGRYDYGDCLLIQPDGKILAGGTSNDRPPGDALGRSQPALVRLHPDGSPDMAFGIGGKALPEKGYDVRDLTLQPDGKILFTGILVSDSSLTGINLSVSRLHPNGAPDTAFGSGGIAAAFTGNDLYTYGDRVRVLPDGSILAGGHCLHMMEIEYRFDFVIARFHGKGDSGAAPVLATQPAAAVDSMEAVLHALINAGEISEENDRGLSMIHFEYAPEREVMKNGLRAYLTAPASPETVTGKADTPVTSSLTGLQPDTIYRCRVRALNRRTGIVLSGDDRTFTTVKPLTNLQKWRNEWFHVTENKGEAADEADPDKDGLVNFMEWATGGNPKAAEAPSYSLSRNGANLEFIYTRSVSLAPEQQRFRLEWTTELSAARWNTSNSDHVVISENERIQQVKVLLPLSDAPRYFVRLRLAAH